MFITIEQKLKFFRDRPDLFLECRDISDMTPYLNTRDFHIFSCLEFTLPFDDMPFSDKKLQYSSRLRRAYNIVETSPNHGMAFTFSGYNVSELIYIQKFYRGCKLEIPIQEFLEHKLSDNLLKYFLFNVDMLDGFDNLVAGE